LLADSEPGEASSLVVTGSSAGGIEALSTLVGTLTADFPAPIVIAQHLDPHQQSRLGEILRARSVLPVRVVETGEVLVPGTVYVVPSGHDVEINDGHVSVVHDGERRARPSVDRLFRTAAAAYGERLVAVILTGMGSDGVAGAREVKKTGGTVVIQEPSTASYPSMPLALAPTLVDVVARVEDIGPVLRDLLERQLIADRSSDDALRVFLTQVRDRSGIDFLQYKMPTIRRRLARLMTAAGTPTFSDYLRFLQRRPEGYQRLISAFLIKVTEFFRDPSLFEYLREQLLPQLIAEARDRERELRVWSAGCATGEEAYSLAVLIAELLRGESDSFNIRIFGTDLDEDAIAFARRGVYPREALENVPPHLIERYFVRLGDAYEVGRQIRNMTIFGQHDLGQRAPFPRIDVALCRNVLIYFTKELQQRTLQLFAFSVRDGGFLLLGKAETTNPAPDLFTTVEPTLKVFQRHGRRVLIPPARVKDNFVALSPSMSKAVAQGNASGIARTLDTRPMLGELVGNFVFNSAIGIVVVDRHYDVLTINAAGRTLLNIHGIGIGEDLIHLTTSVDSATLREMIDAALRNEAAELSREVVVKATLTDEERYLQIACYPEKSSNSAARIGAAILVMLDVTASVRKQRELERSNSEHAAEVGALKQRVQELTNRQRGLLEANDELTTANVDLRSVNEQLLISSEEAASATEEIETLNEEMQATNEELETLNEELQATIEELNTTNDELEARGRELEEAARLREPALVDTQGQGRSLSAALNALEEPVALISASGSDVFQNGAFEKIRSTLVIHGGGRSVPFAAIASFLSDRDPSKLLRATARGNDDKELAYSVAASGLESNGEQLWLLVLSAAGLS
jgi:two-component system, chemotaxis family, CheB/CheR fusion protein